MLQDARDLAPGTGLVADIVIVGAGAAAIAIALDLIGSSTRVLVVESGAEGYSRGEQALYRGHNIGLRYEPLDLCRVKGIGGTTSPKGWAGFCKAFSPLDLKERPWVHLSGWPIEWEDLRPYYDRAWELFSLPGDWNQSAHADWIYGEGLQFSGSDCRNEICIMSPSPHLGEFAKKL